MPRKAKNDQLLRDVLSPPSLDHPESGTIYPDLDRSWLDRIRHHLVEWYGVAGRSLPWRMDRDPYRILVSEMMLVQTTVTTVIPYFARFLERFPTVDALAKADETDVLKAWEGLGYYRRARQLQAAARVIADHHGGKFPEDPDLIRALPGVGRYIAGAILSFAFDRPAGIVEANTQRVLARWLAWSEDLKSNRSQARLWEAAQRLVPETGSGEFNQAFIELGALICIPRTPLCLACPVRGFCLSYKLGVQDQLPTSRPKVALRAVEESCALVSREKKFLILQRGPGRLWEHFWEFPTIHLSGFDPAVRSFEQAVDLTEGVRRLSGLTVSTGPVVKTIRFGVTTHKVTLNVSLASWVVGELAPGPGFVGARWVSIEEMKEYTMGAATRRVVHWLASQP